MLRTRRLLIAGLAIAVCLGGAYAGLKRFWLDLPAGEGPAGPDVPADLFAAPWTDRPVVLLGIGDSVTAGFGARDGYSYFDRLVVNPPDDSPDMRGKCLSAVLPGLLVENVAVSGSTSLQHLDGQVAGLTARPAGEVGIVVMTTGGNDLIHNYGRAVPREGAMYGATFEQAVPWIDAFGTRLDEMVGRIEKAFPGGCHVFLANIYDPTDGTGSPGLMTGLPQWPDALRILDAYNRAIAACADRHASVHMVDIRRPFLGHGLHCRKPWIEHYRTDDPHYWYYRNVEDPNERGYDAIRRLFLLEIARVLAPGIETHGVSDADGPDPGE